MKSFYIFSTGCLRTTPESQRVYDYFLANDFCYTNDPAVADVLFMYTCGYIQQAEDESINFIEKLLANKRENSQLLVAGCLPNINGERLEQTGKFTIIKSGKLEELDNAINARVEYNSIPIPLAGKEFLPDLNDLNTRTQGEREFTIRVSDGCMHNCAYCAIKFAKGHVKSTSLAQIVELMKECVNQGADIIYLSTEDLGCYGQDLKTTVVELLTQLFAVPGKYKLKLHDFNAYWFLKYYDQVKPILVENRDRIHYLFVTVEGGSDNILKRMKRNYHIDDVRDAFCDLKAAIPELPLRCSMMVGFPGETEADFQKTREFINTVNSFPSTNIWLTPYCDRPHTAASEMSDKVEQATIDRRYAELTQIIGSVSRLTSAPTYVTSA